MTENEIKNRLKELIDNKSSDYGEILSLSNELTKFDKNNIRFSVDAGVIDRLGNELVARQETAVSELVKNAYDADATEVKLTFINSAEIGGRLIITDDGVGMSREKLIDGFMRISSTDKIANPYSELYNRKRAGQKGIGRFAVQRLGERLTIITQTEKAKKAYQLTINWSDYSSNKELQNITNVLSTIAKERIQGTTLIIDGLRDKWTEAAIKRIYRYVADILQPFPLSQIHTTTKKLLKIDPGFKTIFSLSTNNGKSSKKIVDDKKMVYDHATAIIDGEIDSTGTGKYTVKSNKLKFEESDFIGLDLDDKHSLFDKVRNIRFKAYYFIYGSDLIPKLHETAIRNMAKTSGGIRLYRNGFRVLPYGESGDDWLGLDASTRRRSILPVHANNNFFGFVEVDTSSGEFEETSSREGVMANESLVQLQNFLYRAILTAVIRIAEHRNIKIATGQKKDDEGNWEKMEIRIRNIAHTLDELDKALEEDSNIVAKKIRKKKQVKSLKKDLEAVAALQKQEKANLFKERSMLRVLSSVGLTVGQFVHEIKYYLDNIQADIEVLLGDVKNKTGDPINRLHILEKNFSFFRTYMAYFDYVISQNVIRELKPLEMRKVVRPFMESIRNDAAKSGILLNEPTYEKYGLYTKPMHPSEWSSILFNFYTNSQKAMKGISGSKEILIECGEENGFIYLEFSDTGIGISKENEERIFDEFFTTTSAASFQELETTNEILGTGLGLKIVKDIVLSYRGNIRVVSPKARYATCIRVEIPKATEKELDEYGL